jgi:rare lipoprotein A
MISIVFALSACQSGPPREPPKAPSATPPLSGGYYKDDGPGDNPPSNLDTIPEAVPRLEPLSRFSNRPYSVFGVDYVPATTLRPYKERGIASWYGRKFHGQRTSSGEPYDMYAMSAAHTILPIPSYARVTNLANGKSVVVRINDRGPFHSERIIDLSYAAAYKLGYIAAGSARVEVESVKPGQTAAAGGESRNPSETKDEAKEKAKEEAKNTYIQVGAFSSRGGLANA